MILVSLFPITFQDQWAFLTWAPQDRANFLRSGDSFKRSGIIFQEKIKIFAFDEIFYLAKSPFYIDFSPSTHFLNHDHTFYQYRGNLLKTLHTHTYKKLITPPSHYTTVL